MTNSMIVGEITRCEITRLSKELLNKLRIRDVEQEESHDFHDHGVIRLRLKYPKNFSY